jgi:hypothetical protein
MGWSDWIRTVEIVPSLTAADPATVEDQVEALARSGCRVFHVDDNLELLDLVAPLVHRYGGVLEASLSGAERLTEAILVGADSVTLADPTASAVEELRTARLQVGGVFDGVVPIGVDLVSLAVDDSPASRERVRALAADLPPGVCLEVVGDLGHDSIRAFYDAGATVIVVGLSIFEREDLPRAYRRLVQALA